MKRSDMPVATGSQPVEVCLDCGALWPRPAGARCPHARVTRFESVTPPVAEMLTQLSQARGFVRYALATLADAARLEQACRREDGRDPAARWLPGAGARATHHGHGDAARSQLALFERRAR